MKKHKGNWQCFAIYNWYRLYEVSIEPIQQIFDEDIVSK